jgi:hypothetical protein
MKFTSILLSCLLWSDTVGFLQLHHPFVASTCRTSQRQLFSNYNDPSNNNLLPSIVSPLFRRLDTIESAGLKNVRTAGAGGKISGWVSKVKNLPKDVKSLTWKDVKPIQRIKSLHGPITYLILAVVVAQKYKSLWKNPAWWFGVAFCVKWFRARYVFKIPVWDRQPNWNNVITSKEQEKDLKAFTCKTCGSTIFIAKTREFFFEGSTGIGGLGCFSCGAKGADNFVMDRDRIVEDVADMDDYFEYERPLDFISRAERRALMKEAGGDEEKANQILVDRSNAQASEESQAQAEAIVNGGKLEEPSIDAEIVDEDGDEKNESEDTTKEDSASDENEDESASEETPAVEARVEEEPKAVIEDTPPEAKPKKMTVKKASAPPPSPTGADDDLDLLGMDG